MCESVCMCPSVCPHVHTPGSGSVTCVSSSGAGSPGPQKCQRWASPCSAPPQLPREAGGAGGSPGPHRPGSGGHRLQAFQRGTPAWLLGSASFRCVTLGQALGLSGLCFCIRQRNCCYCSPHEVGGLGAGNAWVWRCREMMARTGRSLAPQRPLCQVCASLPQWVA